MICKNCGDYFYIRRKFLDLFSTKIEYICDKCYNMYPISLEFNQVLLDEYHCVIISMFKKRYRVDYNLFYKEYSKIINSYIERKGYFLLFFDYVDLNDYALEVLDVISKLNKSNILIVTFYLKK